MSGSCIPLVKALRDVGVARGEGVRLCHPEATLVNEECTLLKAQGPSRTCNESKEEEEGTLRVVEREARRDALLQG